MRLKTPVLLLLAVAVNANAGPDFDREIQPILSENCNYCHGPDDEKREADLRLDQRDAAIAAKAFVPGKPEESLLIERIFHDDPDELMPPPGSHRKLTQAQKELLREWIADGAEYAQHWSFVPLAKPQVPAGEGGEIDRFVREGLKKEELKLQPEASPERLMRRVTFDLTGLPPTQDELDAFLNNKSPDRYEKWIDELLSRSSYGERMAVPWLDAARYADTYGFQVDRDREVWPWRDWVIEAFNENLAYDDFLTWQIAGDLLPNPTREQQLATTFCRLHQQKVEGGSVEEEFRVEYVADRAQTVATAFMGLTFECARCHDHKYDPISQKDYFGLFAFFNNIDEAGLYSYFTPSVPTPAMDLPTEAQSEKLAELTKIIKAAENKLTATLASEGKSFVPAEIGTQIPDELARFDFEDVSKVSEIPNLIDKAKPAKTVSANKLVDGQSGKGLKLTGDDAVKTTVGDFSRSDPFSVSIWIQPTVADMDRAVVFHRSRAWTDAASRGYELLLADGNQLRWSLIHFWPGNAISVQTKSKVPANEWTQVTVSYDGSSQASGLQIFVNGQLAETTVVFDRLTRGIRGGGEGSEYLHIGERMRDRGFKNGMVDDLRVFSRELQPREVAKIFQPNARINHDQDSWLWSQNKAMKAAGRALADVRSAANKETEGVREIMVMREAETPRPAYLLFRGAYDQRREVVPPRVPDALPAFPAPGADTGASKTYPQNRLGLAQWLTEPDHPLTARVAVNRFWQLAFGRGLVGTSEDFGIQGERPVYPGLFDWLSADFVENGWDVKRLMKQIVMSETYRQRSFAPDSSIMVEDPENRLLARGPRYRLPAEMIRDQALAVSGLLVDTLGGKPVKPYETAESFKPSKPDAGDGLYRRSLYTYWKRTGPAPAMMAFDAVKRDVCSVSRETTSTPLQALILLNGVQFVEAARVLAERAYAEEESLAWMFRQLTSREAGEKELQILEALHQEQLVHFRVQPKAAEELLKTGGAKRDKDLPAAKIAALTVVAEALMSYDETVVKR